MKKLKCKIRFSKMPNSCLKDYDYYTEEENLKDGDLVVVHARDEFELAYFSRYDDTIEDKELKWVICKVDLAMHYGRIARREKEKAIKAKLKKEAAKAQELQVYRILAQESPEIAALLNELDNLN